MGTLSERTNTSPKPLALSDKRHNDHLAGLNLPPKNKCAVLLESHFINSLFVERYDKLRKDLSLDKYEVRALLNIEEDTGTDLSGVSFASYSIEQLNALGYNPICDTVLPGSCHFPLLAFYKEHPTYQYYWLVEYDVFFTGSWSCLFDSFEHNTSDLISCGLERYRESENGSWTWWRTWNDAGFPLEKCLKSFNPICRFSNRALEYMDNYLRRGFSAHSEVMIPTALYNAGYTLEDFGGDGEFVATPNRNRFYITEALSQKETMRWRPSFQSIQGIPNDKIVHPLKVSVSEDVKMA